MAYGFWGSKVPIGNYLFSKIVFLGVRWRIFSRQLINDLKRKLKPKPICLINDSAAAQTTKNWLDKGYDKLNIGGGLKNLAGFVNVDFVSHPNVEREIIANILDLSFVPTESISHVHTNHVLEHLTDEQFISQLKEYHRILKGGGLLSIRCPNALGMAYGFWFEPVLENDRQAFVSLGFPPDESFSDNADKWFHKDLYGLCHCFWGDVGNIENQHLNIITPSYLREHLESAGFQILKMTKPESLSIVVIGRKMLANESLESALPA
jgi:SAM-dependent methyltransferase